MKLGKLTVPDENLFIPQKEMKKYAPRRTIDFRNRVVLGEPIKSLQRMAKGTHRTLRIHEGDLVYITTTPTISMETVVLLRQKILFIVCSVATVKNISDNMTVSGHANPTDLQLYDESFETEIFNSSSRREYRQISRSLLIWLNN